MHAQKRNENSLRTFLLHLKREVSCLFYLFDLLGGKGKELFVVKEETVHEAG